MAARTAQTAPPLPRARLERRRRALAAAGVMRYRWQPEGDALDDAAALLWANRERARWEALEQATRRELETLEAAQTRQWRELLGRHARERDELDAAIGLGRRWPLALRWLGLRRHGAGRPACFPDLPGGAERLGADWQAALERRQRAEAASLAAAHEAGIERLAARAGRDYSRAMRGLARRCRRDAAALLPAGRSDVAAGVRAELVDGFLEPAGRPSRRRPGTASPGPPPRAPSEGRARQVPAAPLADASAPPSQK